MSAHGLAIGQLRPDTYRPHRLHDPARDWVETNCYVDLWIEVLSALGHAPEAALGFTLGLDFEGDQFTFFKFPLEDLAELYGLHVQELSIYDSVERHAQEQAARGRLVLVEVDAFYLPDTRGVSYGLEHSKTTIAMGRIDPSARRLSYFHNAGYFSLEGADYDGVFARNIPADVVALFPYVEFVKIRQREAGPSQRLAIVERLFAKHLAAAPQDNPVRAFARVITAQAQMLAERDPAFFHKYAFNTLRQLGANFELLGDHLDWLDQQKPAGTGAIATDCRTLSSGAKAFQFQLARAVTRKRFDTLASGLDGMAECYDRIFGALRARMA